MIVPDVNLLLYAVDSGSPHHETAATWWRSALKGREPIGLPWVTALAFLRLTTNPRIFVRPLGAVQAADVVEGWFGRRHVVPIEPTQRHLALLRGLLDAVGTAGNLVTDAHLAALAIEHGATLCSADADFGRFPGLRWRNPLKVT
ncbi:MAG: type II toxin-antitoxin system VapC family toxin [Actinobacteria bacterium]|nr:type II toxin-antitoxin system VapC family toxin [Actinomycetota bacterium]